MRYFIYTRKSTEEEDRQVLSIEAQLTELREFAAKETLGVVACFTESKTAKEPGRTVFAEMLQRIERGEADGILSWNPDRLARNSVDGGRIIHMIDRGLIKSLKFPTFWCEPTPQGLFMLNIAFGQSKYFVDNLRQNVKRGLRQKIRNGVWPGKAPMGYLNNSRTRKIDVDPYKALLVKKFFELYATGEYTLQRLQDWCHEHGLLSRSESNIQLSQIKKTLENIFYIGLMKYNGEVHEGMHEPLISKKLFDEVQRVMADRGKPRKKKKYDFAFLGLMKCASCGSGITAEKQKGHHYYRCTKKKGPCEEKHFLREENLCEQICEYLQKISLPNHEMGTAIIRLEAVEKEARQDGAATIQNLRAEITRAEHQLEKLLDAYLNEVLSTAEYSSRKEKFLLKKRSYRKKSMILKTGVSRGSNRPSRLFYRSTKRTKS